jgi:UDP-glucose 6-dehydrogenase
MKPTVKIYGFGWVGRAMFDLIPSAWIHDPMQGIKEERTADIAVVAVPTPLKNARLDTSIVAEVIGSCKEPLILCRSTVMPGFCDSFPNKAIVYQPEYLGETVKHPLLDMSDRPFMILGGKPENRRKIIEMYQSAYNANIRIRQVSNLEAEVIKLSENRAIAFKVAQCQELYDACEAAGVDYYTIRDAVYGDDPRFNLFWTFIYPDARGFNSKCIPKDVYGWAAWAESLGMNPSLTNSMLAINEQYLAARASADVVAMAHR